MRTTGGTAAYPPPTRGTLVVWGLLARYPYGGVTWQALQHLVAFRRLGFDVWYVEDSDSAVYHPTTHVRMLSVEANVAFLRANLERIGLGDRWIMRQPGSADTFFGGTGDELAALYRKAHAVLNVCGAQEILERHGEIRRLIYLQTDPVLDQVEVAFGNTERIEQLDAYDVLFTYGENLGTAGCSVPIVRYEWLPTRPPICLDWWRADREPGDALTTVANWKHSGKDVVWNGQTWRWSKDIEFLKFIDLAERVPLALELAAGEMDEDSQADFATRGWRIVASIADPIDYLEYIKRSRGEFTVAKEQYVLPRTGWFSDRSACYLAAGRPVVTQDTGFGDVIPTGEGLFAYSTLDEAAAAIEAIAGDYARHSEAASEIAREYFDADSVLGSVLERAGLL
jgi:hypothetical protein